MAGAHVESIEALQAFKAALWKFAETAQSTLVETEAYLDRTRQSLALERRSYWQLQIRKRQEATVRAREALRAKQSLRNMDGTRPSAVEEEKALSIAIHRLESANHKSDMVRKYDQLLDKQARLYTGRVQRFAAAVQVGIPEAATFLDQAITRIEAYGAVDAASPDADTSPREDVT